MLDFNPNEKTKPKPQAWATFCPGRRPEFKAYTQKNFATSALSYHKYGILFQWVDEEWKEVDRCERPTECAHCGERFAIGRTGRSMYELRGHPIKPAYKRPFVCFECKEKHFCYGAPDPIAPELCGLIQTEY